jgi:membrane fusion protein, copper/silver efflux system
MTRFRLPITLVLIAVAFGLGTLIRSGDKLPHANHTVAAESNEPTVWTCSMHPQFKLPEFGQCPICFMDLIPLEEDTNTDLGPTVLQMSASAIALADIRTAQVTRDAALVDLRLTGRINTDETRTKTIAARVAGRIDSLFVDFTGTKVREGQPLASLYSPELYAAQAELLAAMDTERRSGDDGPAAERATAVTNAVRKRLQLLGLSPEQITAIGTRGQADTHMRIHSPLSGVVVHKNASEGVYVQVGSPLYTVADLTRVWVSLDAHESDLPWLAIGQTVEVQVTALPGRTFDGAITFVDPVLSPRTLTATVRLEVDNADDLLKPGMLVHAKIAASTTRDEELQLTIPDTAPLITGDRAVVYVRLPGFDLPTFEGRTLILGPRAGSRYIVVEGLSEGDLVVAHGAFKIDSALQIQGRPSMMNQDGGGPVPGHHHGDLATHDIEPEQTIITLEVPDAFRVQLDDVLAIYLEIQAALADDDDKAAASSVQRAMTAVDAVDMSLAGNSHSQWMKDAADLKAAFAPVIAAKDIVARRAPLQTLTDTLWTTLQRWGQGRDETIRLFHCPMAYGDQGGDWIQMGSVTDNPYYGSMMLRCGSQTDTLAVAATGGTE